jgi:hypothetical protein
MLLYEYQLHVAAGLSPEPRRLLAELYEHDRCSVNWDLIAEEQQVWALLADVLDEPPVGAWLN